MSKYVILAYDELLLIEGGCTKCKATGTRIGQAIQESAAYQMIESAYDEVKSWFDK